MIHVAPCSCELHVRIRELETEVLLAHEQRQVIRELEARLARIKEAFRPESLLALDLAVARAEKAEIRIGEYYEIVVNLNARIAELTAEIEECGYPGRQFVHQHTKEFEAREREECSHKGKKNEVEHFGPGL